MVDSMTPEKLLNHRTYSMWALDQGGQELAG